MWEERTLAKPWFMIIWGRLIQTLGRASAQSIANFRHYYYANHAPTEMSTITFVKAAFLAIDRLFRSLWRHRQNISHLWRISLRCTSSSRWRKRHNYSLSTAEWAAGAKAEAEAQREAKAKNVFMIDVVGDVGYDGYDELLMKRAKAGAGGS